MKRMKMFLTCWPVMMLLAAVLHSCNEDDSIVANSHYDADIFPDLSYDEMIYVEGGTFTMGAASEQTDAWDREEPAHQVTLSSYYIGKYEVTQALWKAVMGENPSSHKGDNLPVDSVSWNDCQDFIRELNALTGKNFRLPTEAEWEYAARGGNSSKGCKYSGGNEPDKVAWYDDNALYETHEAGLKSPNELGIYDMSGNVCEWCSDWYGNYDRSEQSNPAGASSGTERVLRGGSWRTYSGACRVSDRYYAQPAMPSDHFGLRLVLEEAE